MTCAVVSPAQMCSAGCSKFPVPVVLCNYDGFYGGLMAFLRACDENGTVGAPELRNVVIAADNHEVRCSYPPPPPSPGAPPLPALPPTAFFPSVARGSLQLIYTIPVLQLVLS